MGTGVEVWQSIAILGPCWAALWQPRCSVLLASDYRKLSGVQGVSPLWSPVKHIVKVRFFCLPSPLPNSSKPCPVSPCFSSWCLDLPSYNYSERSKSCWFTVSLGTAWQVWRVSSWKRKRVSSNCSTFTFVHCSLGPLAWSLCGVCLGEQLEEQILSWIHLGYHIWVHGKQCAV